MSRDKCFRSIRKLETGEDVGNGRFFDSREDIRKLNDILNKAIDQIHILQERIIDLENNGVQ